MVEDAEYRYFGVFRLILALLVVFNHAWFLDAYSAIPAWSRSIHIGSAAVLGFFVLSGSILFEAADRWYSGRPMAFIANRSLKIMPAYMAALALSFSAHLILLSVGRLQLGIAFEGYSDLPPNLFDVNNIGQNLLTVVPSFVYFDAFKLDGTPYFFVHYIWAVRVEVVFYLVLAVLIGWRPRLGQPWIAFCAIAAGTFYAYAAWQGSLNAILVHAPTFLLGVSIYGRRKGWGYLVLMVINLFLSAVPAAEIIAGVNVMREPASIPFHGLLGIAAFYAIVLSVVVLDQVRNFPISRRWDSWMGDLSYALYLNHYIVIVTLTAMLPGAIGPEYFWGAVVISMGMSFIMYNVVERPMRVWRNKIRQHDL
ncbi:acyltransferase [Rhizobium sp. AG855]|uniref:acyltransferase family protein n=1 Tax=Rhizobium sp. AG855 TaxID=2183898 RepID=UPI000E731A87|nr:acyltransferase [Rhizobium sp. AG855]RKE84609.1 peptidoglycan/LPS O-acetylase OafA/YrhL [Rhizobium sp. AG855]